MGIAPCRPLPACVCLVARLGEGTRPHGPKGGCLVPEIVLMAWGHETNQRRGELASKAFERHLNNRNGHCYDRWPMAPDTGRLSYSA